MPAAVLLFFRNFRAARQTELLGATRMEGFTTEDWTKDYAEKSPVQTSSTDLQKEITRSQLPDAAAEGKLAAAGAKKAL